MSFRTSQVTFIRAEKFVHFDDLATLLQRCPTCFFLFLVRSWQSCQMAFCLQCVKLNCRSSVSSSPSR